MLVEVTKEEQEIVERALDQYLLVQVSNLASGIQGKTLIAQSYSAIKEYVDKQTEQIKVVEQLKNKFYTNEL